MIPDKIYIPMTADCDIAVNDWSGVPLAQYDYKKVTDNICFIRKDLIEHIIRGALGPQDALNKINSIINESAGTQP